MGDKIKFSTNAYEAVNQADALLIITEWNEFRNPDFKRIKTSLKTPVIFDGRNLYDLEKMSELKFTYYSIGRSIVKS